MSHHGESRRLVCCFLLAPIVMACPAGLGATTWTVSNAAGAGCSDTGSGTLLRPFCTLQVGVDHARPGDLVSVHTGLYGPGPLTIAVSGTAGAPITIRSEPSRAAVVLGPPGVGEAAGQGVLITGSHIVLEGFEVRGAAGTGIRNWGNHVTIRDNYVHDNARLCDPIVIPKCGQGIASNGTSPRVGVVIERNLAVRNGTSTSQDHDYYISSPGAIIRNNVAAQASGFGFQIYPNCDDCLVYNNVAYGNANNSGFLIGGDGATSFSTNVRLYNNISIGNAGYGFWVYRNNAEPIIMRGNIGFANAAGAIRVLNSSPPDNTGFSQVDPRLVDPAGLDFHLTPASPAIDSGDSGLVPPDDIDGEIRILGPGVDIGVDEASFDPPVEVAIDLSFLDSQWMVWSASPMAALYALYRGARAGGPWLFDHVCLQGSLPGPQANDPSVPSPATVFYYLVSGINAAGEGALGETSSGEPRPNPAPCR